MVCDSRETEFYLYRCHFDYAIWFTYLRYSEEKYPAIPFLLRKHLLSADMTQIACDGKSSRFSKAHLQRGEPQKLCLAFIVSLVMEYGVSHVALILHLVECQAYPWRELQIVHTSPLIKSSECLQSVQTFSSSDIYATVHPYVQAYIRMNCHCAEHSFRSMNLRPFYWSMEVHLESCSSLHSYFCPCGISAIKITFISSFRLNVWLAVWLTNPQS